MAEASSSETRDTSRIRIAPTKPSDLPDLTTTELLAFSGAYPPHNPLSLLLFPFRRPLVHAGTHPRHWPDYTSVLRKLSLTLSDDGLIILTAYIVDESGREVPAGMAKMTVPASVKEERRKRRKWRERVMGEVVYPTVNTIRSKLWADADGLDVNVLKAFRTAQAESRGRLGTAREYFLVNILMVHPEYQHRGLGSALLSHCFSIASDAHMPLYIESSPAGLSLYLKHGFKQFDAVKFTYKDNYIERPFMVKEPAEPALAAADETREETVSDTEEADLAGVSGAGYEASAEQKTEEYDESDDEFVDVEHRGSSASP